MLRTLLLTTHVGAGVAGLALGPAAIVAARGDRRRTAPGLAYLVAVTVLCATAAGLVTLKPGSLWPFLVLAAGTQAAIIRSRRPGPRPGHVRLVCGSYVSLVTALAVVASDGSILAWIVPPVVGTVLIERAATRLPVPVRRSSRSRQPSPLR